MRRLAVLALLAACASEPTHEIVFIDGSPIDTMCEAGCGPVSQSGCPGLDRCTIRHDATGACGWLCWTDATGALGDACAVDASTQIDDCASGGYCVDGVCRPFCEVNGVPTCDVGTFCALATPGTFVGTCVPDA